MPSALDQINIIFVLLCTGLIGFFGVRRQRRTLNDYVKVKQPECKFDENFLNGKNLKRQNCHEMADSPEKCELGMPCLI